MSAQRVATTVGEAARLPDDLAALLAAIEQRPPCPADARDLFSTASMAAVDQVASYFDRTRSVEDAPCFVGLNPSHRTQLLGHLGFLIAALAIVAASVYFREPRASASSRDQTVLMVPREEKGARRQDLAEVQAHRED